MFSTDDAEFFVEPVWNDTRNIEKDGRLHVVYRRSDIRSRHKGNHCGVSGINAAYSYFRIHVMHVRSCTQARLQT